jgi:hypothetical protein
VPEDGGEKDGVVYLGKSSFKMKIGVQVTPPAGMTLIDRGAPVPAPRGAPAPRITSLPRITPTPAPVLRTPRPPSAVRSGTLVQAKAPDASMVSGLTMAKTTFIGVCLTTFSFGIMGTVAIDHYWPRTRPECGANQGSNAAVALPVQGDPGPTITQEPVAPAAAEPAAIAVAEPVVAPAPRAAAVPAIARVSKPITAAKPAAPLKPVRQVSVAATPPPAARVVVPPAPPSRGVAPARAAPAQGRAAVRKRAAAGPSGDKASAATEVWVDPFN